MERKDNLIVYTKRIAVKLMEEGFKCLECTINTRNPKYLVWYFENTSEVSNRIAELAKRTM